MDQNQIDIYSLLLDLSNKVSRIETSIEQLKKDNQDAVDEDTKIRAYIEERSNYICTRQNNMQKEIDELKGNKARKLEYWFDKIAKYIIWGVTLWVISLVVEKLKLPPVA